MSAFFKTPQYRFLTKLRDRLSILNTEKNYEIYKETLGECKKLARESYDNIGYREDEDEYAWAKSSNDLIGEPMVEGPSFLNDWQMYFSEDLCKWVLKNDQHEIVVYEREETESLRNKTCQQLRAIHRAKREFEGEIKNVSKKRNVTGSKNKKGVKRS